MSENPLKTPPERSKRESPEERERTFIKRGVEREIEKFCLIAVALITRQPKEPEFIHLVTPYSYSVDTLGGQHRYNVFVYNDETDSKGNHYSDQFELKVDDMPEKLRVKQLQTTLNENERQWFLEHALQHVEAEFNKLKQLISTSPNESFPEKDKKMLDNCNSIIENLNTRMST